jgi:SMC interacting uncharacterized protein involved in chromosome segregation
MSLIDRIAELSKTLLTTDVAMRHLQESVNEVKKEVSELARAMQDIRDRLTRLETAREADRAQIAAELARFKTEVERAELRLTRLLPAAQNPSLEDQ